MNTKLFHFIGQKLLGVQKRSVSKSIYSLLPAKFTTRVTPVHLDVAAYGPPLCCCTKPPVVILPGLLDVKFHWECFARRIADTTGRTVIAVDNRNHGKSPMLFTHTYYDLTRDTYDLLLNYGIRKAVIVGHDVGGRAAMMFALMEPQMVSRLIVLDVSPISYPKEVKENLKNLLLTMKNTNLKNAKCLGAAKAIAAQNLVYSGALRNRWHLRQLMPNISGRPNKTFAWDFNVPVLLNSVDHLLTFPEITCNSCYKPALFIGGQKSHFLPRRDLPGISQLFPRAASQYIHRGGHELHRDSVDMLSDSVRQFLSAPRPAQHVLRGLKIHI